MIDGGTFEITILYDLSPKVLISADNQIILDEQLMGAGERTIIIPCHTTRTRLYITEKQNATVVENGRIVKDQMIRIVGARHQGLTFDERHFVDYCKPHLHHNDSIVPTNYLGYNFPSYLEFNNVNLADALINFTVS